MPLPRCTTATQTPGSTRVFSSGACQGSCPIGPWRGVFRGSNRQSGQSRDIRLVPSQNQDPHPAEGKMPRVCQVVQMALHDRHSKLPVSHRTSHTTDDFGCRSWLVGAMSVTSGQLHGGIHPQKRSSNQDRRSRSQVPDRLPLHLNPDNNYTVEIKLTGRALALPTRPSIPWVEVSKSTNDDSVCLVV